MENKRPETVETRDLKIGYRSGRHVYTVADDITETLRQGEFTALLGPNGAGKSSLLRTLAGFLPPLSGEIKICGKSMQSMTHKEMARTLSVVLTERPPIENLKVEELVGLGRSPYTGFFGRLNDEDREIVLRSMEMAGISDLRGRNAATLSDGERQKTMIAKALAQQTEVIFLDEPTAFLDYPSKVETMLLLRKLCEEEGKCIFLSTHDLEIVLQLSDRLWLMSKREGLTTGTTQELSANGSVGRYFDTPDLHYDASDRRFRIDG